MGYTVAPPTSLFGYTKCSVSPAGPVNIQEPDGTIQPVDNRLAFHVLTNIMGFGGQQVWITPAPGLQPMAGGPTIFLPNNNCSN